MWKKQNNQEMEAVISSFLNKQSMNLWRHPNLLGLKCSTVCTLKWGYETTFNLSYINYEAFFAWISSKAISQRVRLFGTGTISRKYLGNFQIYAFISEVSDQSFKLSTFFSNIYSEKSAIKMKHYQVLKSSFLLYANNSIDKLFVFNRCWATFRENVCFKAFNLKV